MHRGGEREACAGTSPLGLEAGGLCTLGASAAPDGRWTENVPAAGDGEHCVRQNGGNPRWDGHRCQEPPGGLSGPFLGLLSPVPGPSTPPPQLTRSWRNLFIYLSVLTQGHAY